MRHLNPIQGNVWDIKIPSREIFGTLNSHIWENTGTSNSHDKEKFGIFLSHVRVWYHFPKLRNSQRKHNENTMKTLK